MVVGVEIPHDEDRLREGREVVLVLLLGGITGWVVARHDGEPGRVEADLGSNHLHAAALPLEKGKLGVEKAVTNGKEDASAASLRPVPANDGVPGKGEGDVGGQPCLTYTDDGWKGVSEVGLEFLGLAEERSCIPEHNSEGHYWKREVRSPERMGHREARMAGTGVPDW